jgi:hypothetical protein
MPAPRSSTAVVNAQLIWILGWLAALALLTGACATKRYVAGPYVLEGQVWDSANGQARPCSLVSLTNVMTGEPFAQATDESGEFSFRVRPGKYRIYASCGTHESQSLEVDLPVAAHLRLPVTQVGKAN